MDKTLKFLRENFLVFIVYAFLGWIYEVLYFIIVDDKFINRGFLHGPYLPIYGFGALLLWYILRSLMKKKHKLFNINITPVLVFIIIFLITTIVEYISHYILDTYFNIVLWDYSKDYLNINGRVCWAASRNFAIGGTACLYLIQPLVEKLFKIKNKKVLNIVALILFIIVIIDFIITILG